MMNKYDLSASTLAAAKSVSRQIKTFKLVDLMQVGLFYTVNRYLAVPTTSFDFILIEISCGFSVL